MSKSNSQKFLRPPVKYHGGKYWLRKWILSFITPSKVYVEPFGGSATVLLNKKRSEREIYNDLDYSIYVLMLILRDRLSDFLAEISKVEYDEPTYYKFKASLLSKDFMNLDPIQQAVCSYCARRMSRGGANRTFCWSARCSKDGICYDKNSWYTMFQELPLISARLQGVEIWNRNALDVIEETDSPDALFYLDPPYLQSTRKCPNVYMVEMDLDSHRRLSEIVKTAQAAFILSGYPSSEYEEWYTGWERFDRPIANHAAHGKEKRWETECLWRKPA